MVKNMRMTAKMGRKREDEEEEKDNEDQDGDEHKDTA